MASFEIDRTRDLQRLYKWEIEILDYSLLANIALSVSPILTETSPEQVYYQGKHVYFPSASRVGEISIDFKSTSDGLAIRELFRWKNSVQDNVTGLYRNPAQSKTTVRVRYLDNNNQVHTSLEYRGVFPTFTTLPTMDYRSSDYEIIKQSFSVDEYRILIENGTVVRF